MYKSAWRRSAIFIFSVAFLAAAPALAAGVTPNDTARFLAGMKVEAGSPLEQLTNEKFFTEHAGFFDRAWAALDSGQLSKVRAWSSENLKAPQPALFYMFSGPDFLYANAFFPKSETYVLSGLELPGDIPDIAALPKSSIPQELSALRVSLNSVLSYSFFITKDMRTNLYGRRVSGTLPVLFVFLARSGKTTESVSFVELDKEGALHPASVRAPEQGKNREMPGAKGVKITFHGESKEPQTLYYFATDLSDQGTENSGFLKFCEQIGQGDSLIKSASYLPQRNNFSRIRTFLLTHSTAIVQDDTGIPLKDFDLEGWDLRPFGNYVKPISKFLGMYQSDLQNLFVKEHAQPIQFSIGYRWKNGSSSMLLATKNLARRKQASSDAPPANAAPAARIDPSDAIRNAKGVNGSWRRPRRPLRGAKHRQGPGKGLAMPFPFGLLDSRSRENNATKVSTGSP